MLDRLVCWSVLSQPDRVMCQNVDDPLFHQRRETDGAARVIAEYQKGAPVRYHPFMQGHTGHRGCHGVLSNTVMDIAVIRRRLMAPW